MAASIWYLSKSKVMIVTYSASCAATGITARAYLCCCCGWKLGEVTENTLAASGALPFIRLGDEAALAVRPLFLPSFNAVHPLAESEATRSSNKSLSFSKDLVFGPHQLYFSGLSLNREIQLAAGATVFTPTST
ncbi:hypothetical protein OPV22_017524 [Ensete ventricosum]|uniref:Uncharacterized protein n=1 Tax=Ensete ventricosum TaxID=4639 RepID=A0AAV8R273_ENSVE|nr:hypothetical protein OPV22_017524 [Ensete ventricosum]